MSGISANTEKPALNAAHLHEKSFSFILNTLIHEYVHEVSTLATHIESLKSEQEDVIEIDKTGVQVAKTNTHSDETAIYNTSINEGLTQIITDDIFALYTQRTGSEKGNSQMDHREKMPFTPESYLIPEYNIRLYIAFVSVLCDVPEQVVQNGIIRAYFRNASLVPEDIIGLFQDTFDTDLDDYYKQAFHGDAFATVLANRINKEDFVDFLTSQVQFLPGEKANDFIQRANKLAALAESSYEHSEIKINTELDPI